MWSYIKAKHFQELFIKVDHKTGTSLAVVKKNCKKLIKNFKKTD